MTLQSEKLDTEAPRLNPFVGNFGIESENGLWTFKGAVNWLFEKIHWVSFETVVGYLEV